MLTHFETKQFINMLEKTITLISTFIIMINMAIWKTKSPLILFWIFEIFSTLTSSVTGILPTISQYFNNDLKLALGCWLKCQQKCLQDSLLTNLTVSATGSYHQAGCCKYQYSYHNPLPTLVSCNVLEWFSYQPFVSINSELDATLCWCFHHSPPPT